jgi:hypothetical protein
LTNGKKYVLKVKNYLKPLLSRELTRKITTNVLKKSAIEEKIINITRNIFILAFTSEGFEVLDFKALLPKISPKIAKGIESIGIKTREAKHNDVKVFVLLVNLSPSETTSFSILCFGIESKVTVAFGLRVSNRI